MSYTRTDWVSGETPLSAENMNNIEDGIEECQDSISDLNSKTNFRTVEVTGSEFTISANNNTAWVNVPFPSSGTPIAIVGYYILGDANVCHVYSIKLQSSVGEFALRRTSTGSAVTGTITARYLVVN